MLDLGAFDIYVYFEGKDFLSPVRFGLGGTFN
jgi:hypothetical protein